MQRRLAGTEEMFIRSVCVPEDAQAVAVPNLEYDMLGELS
jgi:hypothetical protein